MCFLEYSPVKVVIIMLNATEMITDTLLELVSALIDQGFELPIYVFVVSINDNLVVARIEGNPLTAKTKVNVFLENIKDNDWKLPINCFFVDKTGKSESIILDEESIKGNNE